MTARECAYRGYRRAADACGPARMAMWLASDHRDFRATTRWRPLGCVPRGRFSVITRRAPRGITSATLSRSGYGELAKPPQSGALSAAVTA